MGWTLIAFTVARKASAPAGATGTATITLTPVPGTQTWLVDQIAIECSSTTPTELLIYDRTPAPGVVPCQGTRAGNFTVDDQASALAVLAGDALHLVWSGCSEGAVARARIQYRVMKGTPVGPSPVAA